MTDDLQPPEETAHLGAFDPFEAPIVLDLLHEHGIFAYSKGALDHAESQPYGQMFGDTGRGRIFVDASRMDEARALIATELPERVAELQRALEEGFGAQEELAEPGTLSEDDS